MSSNSKSPDVTVVVSTFNEGRYLRRTIGDLRATLPAESEILVVDDGSTDGSTDGMDAGEPGLRLFKTDRLGVVGVRNFGAAQARGRMLVFSDAHMEFAPGWVEPLLRELQDQSIGAVGPGVAAIGRPANRGYGMTWRGSDLSIDWLPLRGTSSYNVPLLCGCCVAIARETFQKIGGFDAGMVRWGSEDIELCLRLWLLGYAVRIVPESCVAHLFRSAHPYPVESTHIVHNLLRMAFAHFESERLARVLDAVRGQAGFARALAMCSDGDIWSLRRRLAQQRIHDDNWFFRNFGLVV